MISIIHKYFKNYKPHLSCKEFIIADFLNDKETMDCINNYTLTCDIKKPTKYHKFVSSPYYTHNLYENNFVYIHSILWSPYSSTFIEKIPKYYTINILNGSLTSYIYENNYLPKYKIILKENDRFRFKYEDIHVIKNHNNTGSTSLHIFEKNIFKKS